MAYDGYFEFDGEELVNLARTTQLAETLNINTLWVRSSAVQWIEDELGDTGYESIVNAPWYDAGYPASSEFAGIVPLSVSGLDDSSAEANPTEYTTDGGTAGRVRNTTLPLVWNVVLVASTVRGAEYGKRWLDRRLRGQPGRRLFCGGADLYYFRSPGAGAERVHRRNVGLTRGTSVTRKRRNECSATWMVTFTLNAGDPFEYGEPIPQITSLGGASATGPGVNDYGAYDLEEAHCPVYDYTPIYDPDYPALVPSPTAPNFLPEGWGIEDGMIFRRFWARINPVEPSALDVVPVVILTSATEARMIRFGIWPADNDAIDLCGSLYTAIVTYLPPNMPMFLDGEQQAAYAWDGFSPVVRRTDSLVYGIDAAPVEWASLNDPDGLLVTLDIFYEVDSDGGLQGEGDVRAELQFVPKSD